MYIFFYIITVYSSWKISKFFRGILYLARPVERFGIQQKPAEAVLSSHHWVLRSLFTRVKRYNSSYNDCRSPAVVKIPLKILLSASSIHHPDHVLVTDHPPKSSLKFIEIIFELSCKKTDRHNEKHITSLADIIMIRSRKLTMERKKKMTDGWRTLSFHCWQCFR